MKGKLAWVVALIITVYLTIQLTEHVTQNRIIFKQYTESASATLTVNGNFILGYKVVLIVEGYNYNQQIEIIRFYDSAYDWYKYIENVEWTSPNELLIRLSQDVFTFEKKLYLLEEKYIRIGDIGVKIGLPTQSEIMSHERKMNQETEIHPTYN